ncbi:hypothetical protein HID58_042236, partial [Brassica napus]
MDKTFIWLEPEPFDELANIWTAQINFTSISLLSPTCAFFGWVCSMADHVMVIAGEWKMSDDGSWTFSIDKHHMSKIVSLAPTTTLLDLQRNVLTEYFPNTKALPSASLKLATGISTPLVMLTHDGSILYFYHHFESHKGMNLFVTFKVHPEPTNVSQVADNLFPFTTPNQPIQKNHNLFNRFTSPRPPLSCPSPPSTGASKIHGFSLFPDDDVLEDIPTKPASTPAPPKISRFSLIHETVSCGDEMLEEMFKEDPYNILDSCKTEEEEDENVLESELPPDFEDVQPHGYDHDFWDPLIDKDLGGSDVAEVMAGIHVPKTAPHIIQGTSASNWKSEPKKSSVHSFPHVLPNPLYTGTTLNIPSRGPPVQHSSASRCTNTTPSTYTCTPGSSCATGVQHKHPSVQPPSTSR